MAPATGWTRCGTNPEPLITQRRFGRYLIDASSLAHGRAPPGRHRAFRLRISRRGTPSERDRPRHAIDHAVGNAESKPDAGLRRPGAGDDDAGPADRSTVRARARQRPPRTHRTQL